MLTAALDATSMELTGRRKWESGFAEAYRRLLTRMLTGRVIVFLADRFDESMVLLKRVLEHQYSMTKMRWQDMAYKPHKLSRRTAKQIDSEQRAMLWDLQPYDGLLYQLANILLDASIELYDDDIALETKQELFQFIDKVIKSNSLSRYKSSYGGISEILNKIYGHHDEDSASNRIHSSQVKGWHRILRGEGRCLQQGEVGHEQCVGDSQAKCDKSSAFKNHLQIYRDLLSCISRICPPTFFHDIDNAVDDHECGIAVDSLESYCDMLRRDNKQAVQIAWMEKSQ